MDMHSWIQILNEKRGFDKNRSKTKRRDARQAMLFLIRAVNRASHFTAPVVNTGTHVIRPSRVVIVTIVTGVTIATIAPASCAPADFSQRRIIKKPALTPAS